MLQIPLCGQSLFNVLAPATVQEHYTVGVSKKIGKNQEFDFGFAYVPKKIVHGTNPNTGPQTGSLQMRQWQISLGWNWYF
jgi:long-chain fatty acid transport protein